MSPIKFIKDNINSILTIICMLIVVFCRIFPCPDVLKSDEICSTHEYRLFNTRHCSNNSIVFEFKSDTSVVDGDTRKKLESLLQCLKSKPDTCRHNFEFCISSNNSTCTGTGSYLLYLIGNENRVLVSPDSKHCNMKNEWIPCDDLLNAVREKRI